MTGNPRDPKEDTARAESTARLWDALAINAGHYATVKAEAATAPTNYQFARIAFLDTIGELAKKIEFDESMPNLEKLAWLSTFNELSGDKDTIKLAISQQLGGYVDQKVKAYQQIESVLAIPDTPFLIYENSFKHNGSAMGIFLTKSEASRGAIEFVMKYPDSPLGVIQIASVSPLLNPNVLDTAAAAKDQVTVEFGKAAQNSERFLLAGEDSIAAYFKYLCSPSAFYSDKQRDVIYRRTLEVGIDLATDPEIAKWHESRRTEIAGFYVAPLLAQMNSEIVQHGKLSQCDWTEYLTPNKPDATGFDITTEFLIERALVTLQKHHLLTDAALRKLLILDRTALSPDEQ